jgi:hypothetical protein
MSSDMDAVGAVIAALVGGITYKTAINISGKQEFTTESLKVRR